MKAKILGKTVDIEAENKHLLTVKVSEKDWETLKAGEEIQIEKIMILPMRNEKEED